VRLSELGAWVKASTAAGATACHQAVDAGDGLPCGGRELWPVGHGRARVGGDEREGEAGARWERAGFGRGPKSGAPVHLSENQLFLLFFKSKFT
jgi:hypothetical protein